MCPLVGGEVGDEVGESTALAHGRFEDGRGGPVERDDRVGAEARMQRGHWPSVLSVGWGAVGDLDPDSVVFVRGRLGDHDVVVTGFDAPATCRRVPMVERVGVEHQGGHRRGAGGDHELAPGLEFLGRPDGAGR